MSVDKMLWIAMKNGSFSPKRIVEGFETIKPMKSWIDEKTKKACYDLKMGNILIYVLSINVYYLISHHKDVQ